MPQHFVFSESALNEMYDLPKGDYGKVTRSLRRLADDPLQHGLNVRPMKGRDDLYRLRVGDIRVFFTRGSLVEVQAIRRRRETTYSATQPVPDHSMGEMEVADSTIDIGKRPEPDGANGDAVDEALARGTEPSPDGSLPRRLTPELLHGWHVPSEHHEALTSTTRR